jgi:hypothetical protein
VDGQSRAAGHERVIPQPERIRVNVAQIARVGGECLAGHANDFVTLDKDELRGISEMSFDESAVPRWRSRSERQRRICSSSCPHEGIVPTVNEYGAEIELLYIEETCESSTVEGLVAESFTQNGGAQRRIEEGWPLSEVGEAAEAFDAKRADLKSLIEAGKCVVRFGRPGLPSLLLKTASE